MPEKFTGFGYLKFKHIVDAFSFVFDLQNIIMEPFAVTAAAYQFNVVKEVHGDLSLTFTETLFASACSCIE